MQHEVASAKSSPANELDTLPTARLEIWSNSRTAIFSCPAAMSVVALTSPGSDRTFSETKMKGKFIERKDYFICWISLNVPGSGFGGRGRNRTYNLSVKSRMLCQLSYASRVIAVDCRGRAHRSNGTGDSDAT